MVASSRQRLVQIVTEICNGQRHSTALREVHLKDHLLDMNARHTPVLRPTDCSTKSHNSSPDVMLRHTEAPSLYEQRSPRVVSGNMVTRSPGARLSPPALTATRRPSDSAERDKYETSPILRQIVARPGPLGQNKDPLERNLLHVIIQHSS